MRRHAWGSDGRAPPGGPHLAGVSARVVRLAGALQQDVIHLLSGGVGGVVRLGSGFHFPAAAYPLRQDAGWGTACSHDLYTARRRAAPWCGHGTRTPAHPKSHSQGSAHARTCPHLDVAVQQAARMQRLHAARDVGQDAQNGRQVDAQHLSAGNLMVERARAHRVPQAAAVAPLEEVGSGGRARDEGAMRCAIPGLRPDVLGGSALTGLRQRRIRDAAGESRGARQPASCVCLPAGLTSMTTRLQGCSNASSPGSIGRYRTRADPSLPSTLAVNGTIAGSGLGRGVGWRGGGERAPCRVSGGAAAVQRLSMANPATNSCPPRGARVNAIARSKAIAPNGSPCSTSTISV